MFKKILLVSATGSEMCKSAHSGVTSLVTGIGMVATTYSLTKSLIESDHDLVINIGIAGSFKPQFAVGSVVQVTSDRIVELGVEDNGRFIPMDETGLMRSEEIEFKADQRIAGLPGAKGITVNRVHGSADSIKKVMEQFNPDMETMEGAAIAFVCKQFGIPWVQIRAISNKVEPRDRDTWNIPLAIENLHIEVGKCLDSLLK